MRNYFLIFFCSIAFILVSQNDRVEKAILYHKSKTDAKIAEALADSSFDIKFNEPETALEFARSSLKFAQKANIEESKAAALFYMATSFHIIGIYDSAMVYYQSAEKIYLTLDNPKLLGSIYLQIALLFSDSKDDKKAIAYTYKSLNYFYETKDTSNICNAYSNLALFYSSDDTLLHYQKKVLNLHKLHVNVKPEKKALSLSIAYTNLGTTYQKQKKHNEALYYYKLAFEEDAKHNNFLYKIMSYENLGSCYLAMNEPKKAVTILSRAIAEIKNKRGYRTTENLFNFISLAYKEVKMFDSAYYFLKEYSIAVDSIHNSENQQIITDMQQKYDTDKKISEIEILNKDKKLAGTFRKTLYVIIGLILVVVCVLIYSYILKRRSNTNLILKNEEISGQKDLIEKQKKVVEEKQKEIIDSINYARRIQQSLMPTGKYIAKKLDDLKK